MYTKKGFTIIEVLAAMFVLSVGLVAIVQLYSRLASRAVDNKNLFTATAIAQEGLELAVFTRDNNLISDAAGGAFDGMPAGKDTCRISISVSYPYALDCAVDDSTYDNFRLAREGTPEYFVQHTGADVEAPIFWRRVYLIRDTKGTGDTDDDEMQVAVFVAWDGGYVFPSVDDVEVGSYSCDKRDKCTTVSTVLNQ